MIRGGGRRSTIAGLASLALVLSACVSVNPGPSPTAAAPTPGTSPSPSSTAAGSPSPGATAPATVTSSPSSLPTGSLEPSPTTTPGASLGAGFHADTQVLADDFSDSESGNWGTGKVAGGSITNADGQLSITFTDSNTLWSWSKVPQTWKTMRIVGGVDLATGTGGGGWACGSSPGDFVGGVVNNDGEWVFIRIADSSASVIDRGSLPDAVTPVSPYQVSVECAGTDTGGMRLRMVVDGIEAATFEGADGPAAFDRVAAYGSGDAGFDVAFDDLTAYGGNDFGGFPTQADSDVADLFAHIPSAIAPDCTSVVPSDDTALAQLDCQPAGSADEAHYISFVDPAAMDAEFDSLVSNKDLGSGTCQDGPATTTYTTAEEDAGRLACFDDSGETAFIWTDTALSIVGIGGSASDDYAALYDWWKMEAGPVRNP